MSLRSSEIKSVPQGVNSVTPWIITRDTDALIDFMTRVFEAEELARARNADGTIGHAEVRLGDTTIPMFDAREDWIDTPAFLWFYGRTATGSSGRRSQPVTEMTELASGDRIGRVRDPLGDV